MTLTVAPKVTTVASAEAYRARILKALPVSAAFTPLMTAYLTDDSDAREIERGHRAGIFIAAKLYPAHATTHSAHGVTDIAKIAPVLERMAAIGMPLLVHGEVTDPAIDVFDREAVFIGRVLAPLMQRLPALKIVLEHITTKEAAEIIDCTPRHVWHLIKSGQLHPFERLGRDYFVSRRAAESYVRKAPGPKKSA